MDKQPTPHDELLASYETTLLNHASFVEPLFRQQGLLDDIESLLSIGIGAGHLECQLARNFGLQLSYVERSQPMIAAVEANIASSQIENLVVDRFHESFETASIDGPFDLVLSLDSWYHIGCNLEILEKALRLRSPKGKLVIQLMSAERQLYWALDEVRGLIAANDLREWVLRNGIRHKYFEHSHWTPVDNLITEEGPTEAFKHFVAFARGVPWDDMGSNERKQALEIARGLVRDGNLETRHGYLLFT